MALDKDKKGLLRALTAAGVKWEYTKDGLHARVYPPNGDSRPFTMSLNKGDAHGAKNAAADCRRAGININY
jgi:hypothetical protein